MTSRRQHFVVRIEETVCYYYHVVATTPEFAGELANQVHLCKRAGYFDVLVQSRVISANEVAG